MGVDCWSLALLELLLRVAGPNDRGSGRVPYSVPGFFPDFSRNLSTFHAVLGIFVSNIFATFVQQFFYFIPDYWLEVSC